MKRTFISALLIAGIVVSAISVRAQISNFEMGEVYKTASSFYKVKGDTTFGRDVAVYTVADVSLQWPVKFGDNDVSALQDSLLSRAFGVKGVGADDAIKLFLSKPIGYGDYDLEVADPDAVVLDWDSTRLYSRNLTVSSIGFCEDFIVFKIDYDEYSGGAHPNYFCSYVNYDIHSNRTLFFNDIFEPGHDRQLLEIITQGLLDKYYATSLSDLEDKAGIFTEAIHVSSDVYITSASVVFHYNPYDIAPWASGVIDVEVPIYSLLDFLTPEVRSLYRVLP